MNKNNSRNNQAKSSLRNKSENIKVNNSSKSLEKIKLNPNYNNNKFQNRQKLRQHNENINSIYSYNTNRNNIHKSKNRSNSRSDPDKKVKKNKIFPSINTEKIKINNSNTIKSTDKNKSKTKNIKNNNNILYNSPSKENIFKSDIKIKNIFTTNEKSIKINLIKKHKEDNLTIKNLKYYPLKDIPSLFKAWQNAHIIYKAFDEKILKKYNLEIDTKTFEIKTKNHEDTSILSNQKFWILYIEYLIEKNYILNERQFLSIINEAFSYMYGSDGDEDQKGYQFNLLKNYYLEKIKIYAPCYLKDGSFDNDDETYINKLSKGAINLINIGNVEKLYNISKKCKNYKDAKKDSFDDKGNKNNNDIFNKNISDGSDQITRESN